MLRLCHVRGVRTLLPRVNGRKNFGGSYMAHCGSLMWYGRARNDFTAGKLGCAFSSRTDFEVDQNEGKRNEDISFIEKAKIFGANVLLGAFVHRKENFDRCLSGLKVERISKGHVTCSIDVVPSLRNNFGTLHGGATSTLIDVVGTIALLSVDPTKPGVSVEMNISFLSAGKADDTILIEGKVLKMGNRLGFTEVELKSKKDGKTIAIGRHTKAFS